MSKITIAALSAQFEAEQSLTAAVVKELVARLNSQQRQLSAAFARITALEKAAATAATATAAATSRRPRKAFTSTFLKRVEEIHRDYPGAAVKRQNDTYYVRLNDDWHAV